MNPLRFGCLDLPVSSARRSACRWYIRPLDASAFISSTSFLAASVKNHSASSPPLPVKSLNEILRRISVRSCNIWEIDAARAQYLTEHKNISETTSNKYTINQKNAHSALKEAMGLSFFLDLFISSLSRSLASSRSSVSSTALAFLLLEVRTGMLTMMDLMMDLSIN